jgi:hypothetical protein
VIVLVTFGRRAWLLLKTRPASLLLLHPPLGELSSSSSPSVGEPSSSTPPAGKPFSSSSPIAPSGELQI